MPLDFYTLSDGTICQITQFKHLSQVTFNSILTLLFKSMRLLGFILKGLHFFQVIPFNIISGQNTRFRFHSTFKRLLSSKSFTLTIFQIQIFSRGKSGSCWILESIRSRRFHQNPQKPPESILINEFIPIL
ncbi:unnamed protein product [Rotaria socialis]